jgi:hypothetical protein
MSLNSFMFQKNEAYKTIKELRGIKFNLMKPILDGL